MENPLFTGLILEKICEHLSFSELVQLRVNSQLQDIPCSIPIVDANGKTVILPGVNSETIAMHRYLLESGLDTALMSAAEDANIPAMLGFLKMGLSPNTGLDEPDDPEVQSSINAMAHKGDVATLQFLLEHGGTLDITESGDHSPITLAVEQGRLEMINFLINQGYSPNYLFTPRPNDKNYTQPLSLLELALAAIPLLPSWDSERHEYYIKPEVSETQRKVIQLLLSLGADPNRYYPQFQHKSSPLTIAINLQEWEIFEILARAGARIHINPN